MKERGSTRNFEQLSAELMETIRQKCYGTETMSNYRRTLSRIGKFMTKEGHCIYTADVGKAFIADLVSSAYISESHLRFNHTVVRRLNDVNSGVDYRLIEAKAITPVPIQFAEPLESYLRFCARIGNKANTISLKSSICVKFINFLTDLGCSDAQDINTNYICRAIIRHTNKDSYAIIRAFLQHLHETGILMHDYSGIIPKHSRGEVIPTTYSIDEVRRLEATVDRSSKIGKRDYAVILLATRLGLRAGDIVGLTYDSVDFIGSNISISQEKTKYPLTLPLLSEICEAIEDYIKCARPNSDSEYIFLSAKAPFERMTTSAIRHALTMYFPSAGIDVSGKKHGSHSLRSSLASSMVNDGVPYEVVRRLLGHRDPNAVKHYAKIDIENLRCYAIDVPPPSGNFENLLEGRM
jgi:site-specific recombinase XerD